MIKMWVLDNWHVFTTIASSPSRVIDVCNLPDGLMTKAKPIGVARFALAFSKPPKHKGWIHLRTFSFRNVSSDANCICK